MPSTSKKQAGFMKAVANNPQFAKKAGVPTSVGKDFAAADANNRFKKGGLFAGKETKKEESGEKKAVKGKGKGAYAKAEKKFEGEGKPKVKKMASGGVTDIEPDMSITVVKKPVKKLARGGGVETKGKTKGTFR